MSAERSPSFPSGARAVDFSLLVVILAVALAARCWYLTAGVPYAVGIDEPQVVNRSLRILQTGDWNPHVFDYPTLVIYFHAAVAILRFLWGALDGEWASPTRADTFEALQAQLVQVRQRVEQIEKAR